MPMSVGYVRTHGLTRNPLYGVWRAMIARCYVPHHPNYVYYGARGISVCEEWRKDPIAFCAWGQDKWAKGLLLDRINNDGNYEPINCRFATRKISANNQRHNFTEENRKAISEAVTVSNLRRAAQIHASLPKLSQSQILNRLLVDAPKGEIIWRERCGDTVGDKRFNIRWAGRTAGSVCPRDGWHVVLYGVRYPTKYLIWTIAHGEWPHKNVVCVNGDRCDVRLDNLKLGDGAC